jgi:hypothetical protein
MSDWSTKGEGQKRSFAANKRSRGARFADDTFRLVKACLLFLAEVETRMTDEMRPEEDRCIVSLP